MAGLWLKNGQHFNIPNDSAKKITEQLKQSGKATFLEMEVKNVLPPASTQSDSKRLTQSEIDSLRKDKQEANRFCIQYFKENPIT